MHSFNVNFGIAGNKSFPVHLQFLITNNVLQNTCVSQIINRTNKYNEPKQMIEKSNVAKVSRIAHKNRKKNSNNKTKTRNSS